MKNPLTLGLSGLLRLLLAGFVWSCCLAGSAFATEPRPNFLFIAVDDLNDFSGYAAEEPGNFLQVIYPDSAVRARIRQRLTPNLDRLAAHGAPFVHAYCASPLCGPSRTSLMTGVAPFRSGYYIHDRHFRLYESLKDTVTLPQQLKAHGYFTTGLGKLFHTGVGAVDGPLGSDWADARNSWSQWVNHPLGCNGGQPGKYSPPDGGLMQFGPSRLTLKEAGDWQAADFTARLLEQGTASTEAGGRRGAVQSQTVTLPKDTPFFLGCGLFRPHLPFYAPKEFFDKFPTEEMTGLTRAELDKIVADLDDLPTGGRRFSDYEGGKLKTVMEHARKTGGKEAEIEAWRDLAQAYLACVSFADACIGRILEGLEKSPQKSNTVVMLWSDHGFHVGSKYHVAKQALWEEANRVQFIIRDPRQASASNGILRRQLVSLNDLYPTICAMAGTPVPKNVAVGKDLAPLLANAAGAPLHDILLMTYQAGNHSLRTPTHRFMRYRDSGMELYDMRKDPRQMDNLAQKSEFRPLCDQFLTQVTNWTSGEILGAQGQASADSEASDNDTGEARRRRRQNRQAQ
jgi:arylsulfatase A-like enzyme